MRRWLHNLLPRERQALLIGAVALAVAVVWLAVWKPLIENRRVLQVRHSERQEELAWLQRAAVQVAALRKKKPRQFKPRAGQSLLALVDQSARLQGLAGSIRRGEPAGDNRIRLWLDGASFDIIVLFVERMQRDYAVTTFDISVESTGIIGQVNARITFEDTLTP